MSDFSGEMVIVTGGTGSLGGAVVGRLLDLGAECWISCLEASELERFQFRDHDRAHTIVGVDLSDESSCEGFFAAPPSLWASVHIAGGFGMAPIVNTSLAEWRRLLDMNATSCFLSCREAVKRMKGHGGRIVNIAAKPAIIPVGGMVAYSAAKAAVVSITQSLAEEVKNDEIWVNAVVPSIMDTPANRKAMPGADHDTWPSVGSVAETIIFLASARNKTTRGGIVPVFGRS